MKKFDRDICIVTLAATFAIAGMSIFAPVTQAQTVMPAPAASPTAPAATPEYNDGDGDELAEHWTDPKDIREQHNQLAGMIVLFVVTGAIVASKKMKIRRLVRG